MDAVDLGGVEHLPYGVLDTGDGRPRCVAGFHASAVDLAPLAARGVLGEIPPHVFDGPTLNPFLTLGVEAWALVRSSLTALLEAGHVDELIDLSAEGVRPVLPVAVGDYVDFFSSLEHATACGRLFRPDGDPLTPNWRHVPIAYHGRAGSVLVSGTPVHRPLGALGPGHFGPSQALDFELEVAFVAGAHDVFGLALLNDWSARDIQAFESQPLGPFLGKSFATSLSGWVTPLAALDGCWVDGPPQDPPPMHHLAVEEPAALAVELSVEVDGEVVGRSDLSWLYWRMAQQVAHLTSNGATLRPGDLLATGTVSGLEPGTQGCLLETAGARPFLADGAEVVLRGRAAAGFALGECRGRVLPPVE